MLRFSFWLTSLTANQKIFMTIEKAFERDFANRMTEEDFTEHNLMSVSSPFHSLIRLYALTVRLKVR